MKKYTPYVFPLVVLSVVFLLVFRWYSMRTDRLEPELFAEGIEIENLSTEEITNSINGTGDYSTVDLNSSSDDSNGVVRYEIKDGKIRFSVVANLMESDENYTVWLKEANGEGMREIFTLTMSKGGYVGSAALPEELLPFEVIVTTETDPAMVLENNVLHGLVEIEEVVEEEMEQN